MINTLGKLWNYLFWIITLLYMLHSKWNCYFIAIYYIHLLTLTSWKKISEYLFRILRLVILGGNSICFIVKFSKKLRNEYNSQLDITWRCVKYSSHRNELENSSCKSPFCPFSPNLIIYFHVTIFLSNKRFFFYTVRTKGILEMFYWLLHAALDHFFTFK